MVELAAECRGLKQRSTLDDAFRQEWNDRQKWLLLFNQLQGSPDLQHVRLINPQQESLMNHHIANVFAKPASAQSTALIFASRLSLEN